MRIFAGSTLILIFCIGLTSFICGARHYAAPPGIYQTDDLDGTSVLSRLGVVQDIGIKENSGIALSRRYPDALWMHNDSGNQPILYLVAKSGKTLARCRVVGAAARDWEDICSFRSGDKTYLVIGDVGDNFRNCPNCNLVMIEEPQIELKDGQIIEHTIDNPEHIEFRYEDGPRNCEAIGFDPVTRAIWMIEKIDAGQKTAGGAGIYSLTLDDQLKPIRKVARRISDYPMRNVTGMDFHKDKKLIIRNYAFAHLVERNHGDWQQVLKNRQFSVVSLPIQLQGEAICFDADGNSVIVASEFRRQPLYRVRLDVKPDPAAATKGK